MGIHELIVKNSIVYIIFLQIRVTDQGYDLANDHILLEYFVDNRLAFLIIQQVLSVLTSCLISQHILVDAWCLLSLTIVVDRTHHITSDLTHAVQRRHVCEGWVVVEVH